MPRTLRLSLSLAFVCLLATAAALPAGAAIEPCSCEYCLENIDAKCKPPGGGVASCSALIRSGACLDHFDAGTALQSRPETARILDLETLPDVSVEEPEAPEVDAEAPAPCR